VPGQRSWLSGTPSPSLSAGGSAGAFGGAAGTGATARGGAIGARSGFKRHRLGHQVRVALGERLGRRPLAGAPAQAERILGDTSGAVGCISVGSNLRDGGARGA
jgi:hypothetical protein